MRILMVSNTHFQTIVAMQLRVTLFKDEAVVLLVSDHSNGSEQVANRLAHLNFFEAVYYVQTLGTGYQRSTGEKITDFFQITFQNTNRYHYLTDPLTDMYFDEIIVFNYSIETYGVFSILSRNNKELQVSRYEEGILSYNRTVITTRRRKIINFFRRLQGKPSIQESLKNFYCFYPELYRGEFKERSIPQIKKDSKLISVLQSAFDIVPSDLTYHEKYIFFTSAFDFEGGEPIGEYEFICKFAELVGKENLLIKVHPRDKRTIYNDNGFKVDSNSAIPWEVIQLSLDFEDKVFISALSASVLAGSLMSEEKVKTFYVYKCCNYSRNHEAVRAIENLEALLEAPGLKDNFKTVKVIQRIEDIMG